MKIGLLNAIVDRDLTICCVQDFKSPAEMLESTTAWQDMGLPHDCVAFASDESGNLFCFRKGAASVWFWDHDFRELDKIAPNCDKWIATFNAIKPVPEDD